jgi:hypothetical protein
MLNVLFEIRLAPLQGLKLQSFFIHSASHHAIAKALSEQQVSKTHGGRLAPVFMSILKNVMKKHKQILSKQIISL